MQYARAVYRKGINLDLGKLNPVSLRSVCSSKYKDDQFLCHGMILFNKV